MSDKFIPFHLRDINNPPSYLDEQQQQTWIHAAKKAKKNHQLEQQYPPLVVPTSIYEVIFVHKNTTNATMKKLIDYVQDCNEYTFDTESEKSDKQLALIQIQTIPRQLPSLVIILELKHLPPKNSSIFMQIKQFFQLVFRFGNKLYSWGPLREKIYPAMIYQLFDWPILALIINIQLRFPDWYYWALSHCEVCSLHSQDNVTGDDIHFDAKINPLSTCICHQPNPYRRTEKWALQQALICTYGIFIDKSMTLNQWSKDLDPMYSTLPSTKRDKMINYAINDCFATTCLIRPVIESWTFRQVTNIDVIDLFQTLSLSSSSQVNDNTINPKINPQIFKNVIDDDIEFISDDDDEILLARCINGGTKNDPLYETISDDDNEPITTPLLPNDNDLRVNNHNVVDDAEALEQGSSPVKPQLSKKRRSAEARKRRNRKRNNTFRSRRYDYFLTRQVYHRFTMQSVRNILDRYDIDYTHVKPVDGTLVIGTKNEIITQQYQRQLPDDIFNRYHYYEHRRRSRYSS